MNATNSYDIYTDGRSRREKLLTRYFALKRERSSWEQHWRELARWGRPTRDRFFVSDRNKGDRRNQDIIDSTATFALRTLQSGFQAGLTSPARPWFRLTTPDPALAEQGDVKAWLHQVAQRMQIVMLRSNLYNQLPNVYGDLGLFATSAIAGFEDAHDVMRWMTYPIGSYVTAMDARGRPSVFMREYELTIDQLIGEFGSKEGGPLLPGQQIDWSRFSLSVKNAWQRGNRDGTVTVMWTVMNNDDYKPDSMGPSQWPVKSCYFEYGRDADDNQVKGLLRESGYSMWPVMVPRWDALVEDAYGKDSPGMVVLGDVKQLQKEQRRKGQALEKMINPPVQAPQHLLTQKVSLLPSDVTYTDVMNDRGGVRPIHEVNYPVREVTEDIREVQYRIKVGFYEPLFLMLAQSDNRRGAQPVTAREVEERHEEKLIALGPVLERTNDELLDPLIDRIYQLMDDAGLLPEPPPSVKGIDLGVEYVSIMAQAQKLVGVVAQDRLLNNVMQMAAIWPEARHAIRVKQVIDNYADQLGVDPEIVTPDDEFDAIVAAERQQMAQQMQAQQGAEQAKSARDLAAADMTEDSALRRLVEGVAGG